MADGTQIIIEGVNVNPHTGHLLIRVKSVTTQGNQSWEGPVRSYGVDAAGFQSRFGGDLEHLKAWIKSQHQGFSGVHNDLIAALDGLKGQAI